MEDHTSTPEAPAAPISLQATRIALRHAVNKEQASPTKKITSIVAHEAEQLGQKNCQPEGYFTPTVCPHWDCKGEGQTYNSMDDYNSHRQKSHQDVYWCTVRSCTGNSRNQRERTKHLHNFHHLYDWQYHCPYCDWVTTGRFMLNKHVYDKHPDRPSIESLTKDQAIERYGRWNMNEAIVASRTGAKQVKYEDSETVVSRVSKEITEEEEKEQKKEDGEEKIELGEQRGEQNRNRLLSGLLNAAKQAIIDQVMEDFWLLVDRKWDGGFSDCAGQSPTSAGDANLQTPTTGTTTSQASKYKRKHSGKDDRSDGQDEEGDDDERLPRKKPDNRVISDRLHPKFSCPFRKHDPLKYNITTHRLCALNPWHTIARLKEHLYRIHKAPLYCKRCWEVFSCEELLNTHETVAKVTICETVPGFPPSGVTPAQIEQLKSRNYNRTDQEKWREIFKILFPTETDVPSPYFEQPTEYAPMSPGSQILGEYESFLHTELPNRFRNRIEQIVMEQVEPLGASLLANMTDIIRECQEQLSREFRGKLHLADVSIRSPKPPTSAFELAPASQKKPPASNEVPIDQPPLDFEAVMQVPPLSEPYKFGDFASMGSFESTHDDKVRNDNSDSGYGTSSLCNHTGGCGCAGPSSYPRTQDFELQSSAPLDATVTDFSIFDSIDWGGLNYEVMDPILAMRDFETDAGFQVVTAAKSIDDAEGGTEGGSI